MKDDPSTILECPECRTRYEIPVAIPDEGRKVRCANCGHIWTVRPGDEVRPPDFPAWDEDEIAFKDPEESESDAPGVEPSDVTGPEFEAVPVAEPEFPVAEAPEQPQDQPVAAVAGDKPEAEEPQEDAEFPVPEEPEEQGRAEPVIIGKARRRFSFPTGVTAGWCVLCLVFAGTVLLAKSQRETIVRALPGSAWVYEALGMPVNIRGLDFRGVAYSWEADRGRMVLEVHGDIVNITQRPLAVPTVVFDLRDQTGTEIYRWQDDVLKEPLGAGQQATFATRIPAPPKSVKSVQVRFAKER